MIWSLSKSKKLVKARIFFNGQYDTRLRNDGYPKGIFTKIKASRSDRKALYINN